MASQHQAQLQNRLIALFTLLVIPGFVLATSLPALAVGVNRVDEASTGSTHDRVAAAELQTVDVSASVEVTVTRTAFSAETHAQVAARHAIEAQSGLFSVIGPRAAGDDYPWRAAGGGFSPLGYVTRQCTDFVAWRLNRDAGHTNAPYKYVWAKLTPGGGNASQWAAAWNAPWGRYAS